MKMLVVSDSHMYNDILEHITNKWKNKVDLLVHCGDSSREFDSCLQFFTNQIAQNVDYINAFEFFYCQIYENNCTNMG
jgi:predicted phosphodiesterase